jgi:hypothetical protein
VSVGSLYQYFPQPLPHLKIYFLVTDSAISPARAPETTYLALALILSAFGFRHSRTLSINGGIDRLPDGYSYMINH